MVGNSKKYKMFQSKQEGRNVDRRNFSLLVNMLFYSQEWKCYIRFPSDGILECIEKCEKGILLLLSLSLLSLSSLFILSFHCLLKSRKSIASSLLIISTWNGFLVLDLILFFPIFLLSPSFWLLSNIFFFFRSSLFLLLLERPYTQRCDKQGVSNRNLSFFLVFLIFLPVTLLSDILIFYLEGSRIRL